MGQIQLNTASGPVKINIAGELPTEEEKKFILKNLDEITKNIPVKEGPTTKEISNYYRKQPQAQEAAKEDIESAPKLDIDTSGVKNIGLRADLAQAENDKEYRLRLARAGFTEDQYFKDPEKGYVIKLDKVSSEVKKKYGLPNKGNLAVEDEAMFTKQDFAEFFSSARGPIMGGIVTSLAASGYGTIPAMLLVGGGSLLGYLFDEGLEYAEGVQAQDTRSVTKTALIEGVAGMLGEGAGRGAAAVLGRLLKGPASEEANLQRALVRPGVDEGGMPTVRGVNMSPVLGRMQAIYEGMIPSTKAARKNAEVIANRLAQLSPDKVDSDKVLKAINDDITRIYGTPKELLEQANRNMKELLDTEIDKLIKTFGEPDPRGGAAVAKNVEVAKRTFDEDVDSLYAAADDLLGGQKVINTTGLVNGFNKIVADNKALDLENKGLGVMIKALGEDGYTDLKTMQSIRTALRHASFDKDLVGTPEEGIIRQLRRLVDRSFQETEAVAADALQNKPFLLRKANGQLMSKEASEEIFKNNAKLREGFDLLRKAGQYYKSGVARFKQKHAAELFRSAKDKVNFNPKLLYEEDFGLLIPNNGKLLKNFLKTVVPSGKSFIDPPESVASIIPETIVTLSNGKKSTFREVVMSLPKTDFKRGIKGDPLRDSYEGMFAEQMRLAEDVAMARATSKTYAEAVRKSMAATYLDKAFSNPMYKDAFGNIDASKISQGIYRLGDTAEVLFGKDYDKILKSIQDMQALGKGISKEDLAAMAGRPLTDKIEYINDIMKTEKNLKGLDIVRALERSIAQQDPEIAVKAIFKKDGENSIRQAKELFKTRFGENSRAMNQIQDLALSRILSVAGDPDMTSREFIDAVFTGKAASAIKTKLDSYGRGTLDEMFGKEITEELYNLARLGTSLSQDPIKGLGGLAPASTIAALGGVVGFILDPLTTITTLGTISVLSKLLRSKPFLKLISRPTGVRPGTGAEYDKIGRGLEMVYEAMAQVGASKTTTSDQPPSRPNIANRAYNSITSQIPDMSQITSQIPNITGPAAASSASRVNPILVPDPTTRATFGGG